MAEAGDQLNIAVIGTGSIGAVVALACIKDGHHVELVTRDKEAAERLKDNGLRISGHVQGISDDFKALSEIKKVRKPDILFLATRANDLAEAAQSARGRIGKNTLVVSLQNGMCEELIAEIIDMKQVIGCAVGFSATRHDLGVVEVTSPPQIILGHYNNSRQEELGLLKEVLHRVISTKITTNIKGHLFSKLIINACMNPVGAITGYNLGQMLKKRRVRNIFLAVMREALQIAEKLEIKVEPYAGKLDFYQLSEAGSFFKGIKAHAIMRVMGLRFKDVKSSTLASIRRGQPSEIDYLNGYLLTKAAEHKIEVPVNRQLVELVKQVEEKRRKIGPENLKEIKLS